MLLPACLTAHARALRAFCLRGLGALEGLTWESANTLVRSGDLLSPEWRPPRGTDGTPHESISDVLVRMRQVIAQLAGPSANK